MGKLLNTFEIMRKVFRSVLRLGDFAPSYLISKAVQVAIIIALMVVGVYFISWLLDLWGVVVNFLNCVIWGMC